jgi:diguanylate cyclase (GGDEF)-like protein
VVLAGVVWLSLWPAPSWPAVAVVGALLAALYGLFGVAVGQADALIASQALEHSRREAQIRHQAHHDALTGLANRASFSERLTEALSHARRHSRSGALMFIDLDRFKNVNDNLGHAVGDELLKTVAERIHGCLRSSDLLFRMGGDEFTVILPELAAPQDAAHLARRIIEAVSAPVPLGRHLADVSASVGIAIFPGDGEQPEVLVKNADAAMLSAKQAGRSTHAFYRAAMNEHALRRLALDADLHKAMRQSEFELHYQPRWHAATRRLVGAEALLRWHSPQRGLVLPGEFIDVLEASGQMLGVGEWVLRTACIQQRRWADEGVAVLRMSVNVSRRQFESPGFTAMVARVLQETSVQPGQIELELDEPLLLAGAPQAMATLQALKALGVRIAIDGFGLSSLACLRELPVDGLRIASDIVAQVAHNPRERAVASAIIGLAEALGTEVVALGVETEAQASFLAAAHCHALQGFLLGRPCLPEQLPGLLAQAGEAQAG